MLDFLTDFFVEKQPTIARAYDKAARAGYTVHGVNHEGQPASWQFMSNQAADMNDLLDHELSVRIGEQYRLQTYGPDEPTDPGEASRRRHEIYHYRIKTYHEQEYKPGWKRLLGL